MRLRRRIAALLCLALLLGVMPEVRAQETGDGEPRIARQGGVSYRLYPDRYAEVYGLTLGVPADLVIPESVEGLPVKRVCNWALSSDVLRSVELPDTVEEIAAYAMTDCRNLERLRLPEGLQTLDASCVAGCGKLRVLHIPASVTQIQGDLCFNRVLMGASGSCAEAYALRLGGAFAAEQPGAAYVTLGTAACRVEPEGAVLVGLALSGPDEPDGGCYYAVPDTVGGLPVIGVDGGAVFTESMAETLYLGANVRWIAPGALERTGIVRLYTHAALTALPEPLFGSGADPARLEIYGDSGSDAQRYAGLHGIRFVELDGVPFTDVPRESWFFESVRACYWSGLMNGTSGTAFSPHSDASRAMLVTVLWRMMGAPPAQSAHFADVPIDHWGFVAINWAAENGVAYGTGPNRFAPNQSITREQTAAILFRLADATGLPTDSFAPLGGFRDAAEASAYARSALMWAVDAGILRGNDKSELRPLGRASRAELATMLTRFLAWQEEIL